MNDEPNYFGEVLLVLGRRELVNICRRLRKAGYKRTAEVINDEIDERDALMSAGQKMTQ